jgi:cardiolipin synthase
VKPLRTGKEAFPAMLDAISKAQSHVHFEMYIWRADQIGRKFQAAMIERAKSGCAVRVLYDGLGSFGLPASFVQELRDAGIEVISYHPPSLWSPRTSWFRNHKKILIVDDKIGFTGGINVGDEYVPVDEGGGGWFDWHAQVEGPAVRDLARAFRRTWLSTGGSTFPEPAFPGPSLGRNVLGVEVVSNINIKNRWRMHRAYLWAIHRAEREISIMNSYFIPERTLRRAFARAVQRGVQVRVIVPSVSDVPVVAHASKHLHKRLIQRGVKILEWPERMMHAKFGVIDGVWSTIGSFNLDRRSIQHSLEVGLVVIDPILGARLAEGFESDVARCREVTIAELDARSWWNKLQSWFWYQLRPWL